VQDFIDQWLSTHHYSGQRKKRKVDASEGKASAPSEESKEPTLVDAERNTGIPPSNFATDVVVDGSSGAENCNSNMQTVVAEGNGRTAAGSSSDEQNYH
jgi:hypothetical protein